MKDIKKVTGKIEFCEEENKCYDRTFVARLAESSAFQYGNQTCVVIEWGVAKDGCKYQSKLIDTRYEIGIVDNFEQWLRNYFESNYCEHILTID